jgi:hypothetical protein
MDKEKTIKSAIGLGAVGLAAYLAYTQLTGEENTSLGGSGSFSGLGGAESLTEEGISGTSDSGIAYNINLPQVDTSGIEALISGGSISPSTSEDKTVTSVITGAGESAATLTKKAASSAGASPAKAETSGSLSSSLAQVFGTQAQKTNERGDYYTTAAGGGAGQIKGLSLGEMALNLLSGKTASGQSSKSEALPTGATTANSGYNIPSSSELKSIFAAETAKKEAMTQAISKTKIGAYTPVSDPLQALKDSGIVKKDYNPSSPTASQPTTKKASTGTYKEGGQTKYKDASGKTHIVVKKKK